MKFSILTLILGLVALANCSDQPKYLSGKTETIEVSYVNWACDCANFIETKYFKNDPHYETNEKDCIFIEAANGNLKIPDSFYDNGHFENCLKLSGQFYTEEGVPGTYKQKTPEKPEKAKVFRYERFEFVSNPSEHEVHDTTKSVSELIAGTWVHDEDSFAIMIIANNKWIFKYSTDQVGSDDIFNFSVTDKLPQFVKQTEKADFIILTNKADTMYYEVLGLNKKVLSLFHYPSGRRHLYNRKNNDIE